MNKNEIAILYGWNGAAMARRLAQHAGLAALIGNKDARIGLKPNLVVARPAEGGATTHPEIAEGLIQYLLGEGFYNLVIMEGSWVGDRTAAAFPACGYTALAEKYGVELIDTQKDSATTLDCKGMELEICDSALGIDFMINLPLIKGHCQTKVTCALKNNKGLIPNSEKNRYHRMGLHTPIAHLNTALRCDFIVADGICPDPDFEEGGSPLPTGMLLAARDPVLCDAYAARLLGYAVEDIPYIGKAAALGVGNMDVGSANIAALNSPSEGGVPFAAAGKVGRLRSYVKEWDACSACAAALIGALDALDETALHRLPGPVCVGQGWRGKRGTLGIGACTAGFAHNVTGCPPTKQAVLEALQGLE